MTFQIPKFFLCIFVSLSSAMLLSCQKKREVTTSFYYWKTVYQSNKVENQYFSQLNAKKLHVRIMDVDINENGLPAPVSPVSFRDQINDSIAIVPVVFIVNQVLKNTTKKQLDDLAAKIVYYVNGKIKQAGKKEYNELQLDCDWTGTTRDNYFYLLQQIRANKSIQKKQLSATLRLHQLKNQASSGIPPVDRVMLMCYNMGNLRKYGTENSILTVSELKKYLGDHLSAYRIPLDVGLPLFRWAVVFRQRQYAGISKGLHADDLEDSTQFKPIGHQMYNVLKDRPQLGLKQNDKIRWEDVPLKELQQTAATLTKYLSTAPLTVIYFHLDEPTLKQYTHENLQETTALFR